MQYRDFGTLRRSLHREVKFAERFASHVGVDNDQIGPLTRQCNGLIYGFRLDYAEVNFTHDVRGEIQLCLVAIDVENGQRLPQHCIPRSQNYLLQDEHLRGGLLSGIP
ncbi:MAG: hypothetical protein IPP85_19230 [Propionivibrio sp.]|nr:hypothetical protein [Propionivibrio sp.]